MSDAPRHEYVLELESSASNPPEDDEARHPVPGDLEGLASLMLDAYLDTIDYDGETRGDAVDEVARYLAGAPLLEHSWLRLAANAPASASLVSHWRARDCAIVSYVMTSRQQKGKGTATELLARTISSLGNAGHSEVRAVITEGNVPSERLFARAGFRRV